MLAILLQSHLSEDIVPLRLFNCYEAGIDVIICAQLQPYSAVVN